MADPTAFTVHLVIGNGVILAAYSLPAHAVTHSRCVTGARTEVLEVSGILPESILDQLQEDFTDDEDNTPVEAIDPRIRDVVTRDE